jgi:iron(III) transport system substrate-binding protein
MMPKAFFMLFFVPLCFVSPLWAVEKGLEGKWNETLGAARKEGKVVVSGPPNPVVRLEVVEKFKERFGIAVEYVGGGSGKLAARLGAEQDAGLHTIDVFLAGPVTPATVLYPEKRIDPIKPVLVLPEVMDPRKWKPGKLWFIDPEERYVLRLFNSVREILHMNTSHVKRDEFRSVKELLNPKWKGKISVANTTDAGTGSNTAAQFYIRFGEDFVRKLYIDQRPVISSDSRQMVDWLARGTYPISLGARDEEVQKLREEGFPVTTIYRFQDWPGALTWGSGNVVLINKAPHPNAARVFVNWIASKEGLEIYARANRAATTRNDIDESSLPREIIPASGIEYFDSNSWEFTVTRREEVRARMRQILQK